MKKPKTVWWPLFVDSFKFCVCVTEADMKQVARSLKMPMLTDRDYGAAVHDGKTSDGERVNILHIPNWENGDSTQLGLLVHEATHVAQNLMDHINEKEPSPEFQAFMVQGVFNTAHKELQARTEKGSKK